ncbi:ATP-dependent nuclease [Bdellovibrio bacteriovorus]|uniref:ATP-dependent nuclease n=1 Tax=Bdellovibrio bacteriovorus TaxID=959 RepID=UPI003AA93539
MKVSRVVIEHFRGVKKAEWNVDSKMNILAGPNNSGKTTILKAIELFFSIETPDLKISEFAPRLDYYQGGRRTLSKIRVTFNSLTDAEKAEFSDVYSIRKDELWVELRISKTGDVTWSCSIRKESAKATYEKVAERFAVLYVPVLRIGAEGLSSTESQRLYSTMSEILVRTRGRESLEQRAFRKKIEGAVKTIKKTLDESWKSAAPLLPRELKLKTKTPTVGEVVHSILEGTEISTNAGGDIDIKDEGTGIQSLMAIGLIKNFVSKNAKKVRLILLEEPEAFLHPQLQRKLAGFLVGVSEGAQIFVTTHSSVIIDAVDLSTVARLERQPEGLEWEWIKEILSSDESGHLGRFCDAKNSELVFAGKVIFCEGITDRNVIAEILDALKDDGVDIDGVSVIEMGGKHSSYKFAMLANRFNITSMYVVDRDFYKVSDRTPLKNLIREEKWTYPASLYNEIDKNGDVDFLGRKDAWTRTASINELLKPIKVFVLSTDVEGAVVTSIKREEFLRYASASGIKILSEQERVDCLTMRITDYDKFLFGKVGSKGWGVGAKKKSEANPKSHILAEIVRKTDVKFVKDSDMSRLKKTIRAFIAAE